MQNFKMIFFGFLGALLFHLAKEQVAISSTPTFSKVVSASAFNLVDEKGKMRGQIAISKEGPPGIWLMDEKGVPRLTMGLYQDGTAYYGLQDKRGQMIQLARSFGNDEAPLLIFKNKGTDMMIMGLNPSDTTPFLMRYERDRKRTLVFGKYDGP